MLFSEPTFLFWFLPLLLVIYYASPTVCRNTVLTLASLLFYAWGEYKFVFLIIASIVFNYGIGLWIEHARAVRRSGIALAVGVVGNLAVLGFFKYANFFMENLNLVLQNFSRPLLEVGTVPLPIGISFFTFHAMSYLIDVYRNETPVQRQLMRLTLYLLLFPQLIAGPIVRYHDVALQLLHRQSSWEKFASGVSRFILGLGKKMMLANAVAWPADEVFALPVEQLTSSLAWLGVSCYMLQIYLDFSAYSDMAIGLARMFGFEFLENFRYPYISRSITEFWRRWHISLSNWYRDYLYIPLGGNRLGPVRTYANLVLVFFLCGLWHGASWTFVVWGLLHGIFLILERTPRLRFARVRVPLLQHLYVLAVVAVGWIFFRADTLAHGLGVLWAMVGLGSGSDVVRPLALYWNSEVAAAMIIGGLVSTPIVPWSMQRFEQLLASHMGARTVLSAFNIVLLMGILFYSSLLMAANTYNPFIYFRF